MPGAVHTNPETQLDINFVKLVGKNASAIDRTNSFSLPFSTKVLWEIPKPIQEPLNIQDRFNEALINRAVEILSRGNQVILFYSGGLDSTSTLVAFDEAINQNKHFSKDQVKIATSVDAMYENLQAWWDIVLSYETLNVHVAMQEMDLSKKIHYVFSENADQLFGSDKAFLFPAHEDLILRGEFSFANVRQYLDLLNIHKRQDEFMLRITESMDQAPFQITYMRELLWWFNFTCKWQSVALRALCFTDVFKNPVPAEDLQYVETFYNSVELQQLAMCKNFIRWGEDPKTTNYKMGFRNFIEKMHPSWKEYVTQKVKLGSLYNVIKHREYNFSKLYVDNDIIYAE